MINTKISNLLSDLLKLFLLSLIYSHIYYIPHNNNIFYVHINHQQENNFSSLPLTCDKLWLTVRGQIVKPLPTQRHFFIRAPGADDGKTTVALKVKPQPQIKKYNQHLKKHNCKVKSTTLEKNAITFEKNVITFENTFGKNKHLKKHIRKKTQHLTKHNNWKNDIWKKVKDKTQHLNKHNYIKRNQKRWKRWDVQTSLFSN